MHFDKPKYLSLNKQLLIVVFEEFIINITSGDE
jgi:hypothetical protein